MKEIMQTYGAMIVAVVVGIAAAVGIWGFEEQNGCGICATGYIEQR